MVYGLKLTALDFDDVLIMGFLTCRLDVISRDLLSAWVARFLLARTGVVGMFGFRGKLLTGKLYRIGYTSTLGPRKGRTNS